MRKMKWDMRKKKALHQRLCHIYLDVIGLGNEDKIKLTIPFRDRLFSDYSFDLIKNIVSPEIFTKISMNEENVY
ncbi:hypothetical protein acsn021_38890 [Anaerocolumna cellulosilytica]|uniref:Uncharacterized protein n=1 Tax=Anaerocolumna cellulosilytica TaxID=433286 RepID=A0A6S6RA15_9FIRM|nr:hypothetical protein acsn021_38890 [Anaerocolumna cellulosilytica]